MIVIVRYTDLYYIYSNYYDRYFSLKDKHNTRLDFHFMQYSMGSVGCETYTAHTHYFHSHIFSEKFPSVSISDSKTPITLLRNASLPFDDVL